MGCASDQINRVSRTKFVRPRSQTNPEFPGVCYRNPLTVAKANRLTFRQGVSRAIGPEIICSVRPLYLMRRYYRHRLLSGTRPERTRAVERIYERPVGSAETTIMKGRERELLCPRRLVASRREGCATVVFLYSLNIPTNTLAERRATLRQSISICTGCRLSPPPSGCADSLAK